MRNSFLVSMMSSNDTDILYKESENWIDPAYHYTTDADIQNAFFG